LFSYVIFEGRTCVSSDYYQWELTDQRNDSQHCSLGKKQKFERRLPDSKCVNGYNYDRAVSVGNCICTRQDFMWYVIALCFYIFHSFYSFQSFV